VAFYWERLLDERDFRGQSPPARTLYTNDVVQTGDFASLRLFVFIFSQAYVIASRFSRAFARVEALSWELKIQEELEIAKEAAEAANLAKPFTQEQLPEVLEHWIK
jgi:hypothetical protein